MLESTRSPHSLHVTWRESAFGLVRLRAGEGFFARGRLDNDHLLDEWIAEAIEFVEMPLIGRTAHAQADHLPLSI